MEFKSQKPSFSSLKTSLLVIAVHSEEVVARKSSSSKKPKTEVGSGLRELDAALGGALLRRLQQTGFNGAAGQSSLLQFADREIQAVLVYGWDKDSKAMYDETSRYRKLASACYEAAKRLQASEVMLATSNLDLKNEALVAFVESFELTSYRFTQYQPKPKAKNKKEDKEYVGPSTLTFLSSRPVAPKLIERGQLFAEATAFARDLINQPPNQCTPRSLMQHCQRIAKENGFKIDVHDPKGLKKLGAGALLAVAAGSDEPAYLIRMTYKPKKATKRVVAIVGKGITFDSGGLSIKPGAGMENMKIDMSGAAAVMAVMSVISRLQPAVEVRAYVPTSENMINGHATRPGDIVTAMSGKTIEILNTDAEGRLILADAVTLAEKDGCPVIIDLATLTGACMVALGTDYAGMFANDDRLADGLMKASERAGERLWRLPLAPEYRDWIKSAVANIKNIGKPFGGAITGALFIQEFITKAQWAHLDIAGPAFVDGDQGHIRRGGVGFGVRTLLNYLS